MVNIGKYTIFRNLMHICNLIVQRSVHSYTLGFHVYYSVNVLKFLTLLFLFANKMLVIRSEIHKILAGKTLVRLHL